MQRRRWAGAGAAALLSPRSSRGVSAALPRAVPTAPSLREVSDPRHRSSSAPGADRETSARTGFSSLPVRWAGLGWAALPCAPLAQRENPRAQKGGTCPLSNEKIFIRQLLTKTVHLPLTLEYILKDLILPFPVVICLHIPEKQSLQALWMLSPLPAITVFACSCLFLPFSQPILIVWWLFLGFVFFLNSILHVLWCTHNIHF